MPVRIALIGTGVIAKFHTNALAKVKGARIVAVCDKAPGKAEAFARERGLADARVYTSHRKMLADGDMDAVYILLPPYAHGLEQDVIEARRHFFVEKPVHLDLAKAEKLRDAARRRGLVTCAGYMTRYRKGVQKVKRLMAKVDQPTLLHGGWFGPPYMAPWWINKRKSGGQHLEQTTHTFDLARYLFGEVKTLQAFASKGAIRAKGYTIEDGSSVNLRFRNGAVGCIMSCCALPKGCEGGGIHLSVYTNRFAAHFRDWRMGVTIYTGGKNPKEERIEGEEDIFEFEDRAFVKAVATGRQEAVLSSYADGIESLRLSILASESMKNGAPVRVR